MMYEETHPVLIGDLRPKSKWGDISPKTAAKAAEQLLKNASDSLLLDKFGKVKLMPPTGSTIKWRKYLNAPPNHMVDALVYGTGVSHVYYDEETEETEETKEVSGKNPDGTIYPVARGQIKI
jgi:hypothetical protein